MFRKLPGEGGGGRVGGGGGGACCVTTSLNLYGRLFNVFLCDNLVL